jgi:Protein of unknown function (DUF3467).
VVIGSQCLDFPASIAQNSPAATSAVQIDASGVRPTYANFSRVSGTPEEVIVDFGLNDQPVGVPKNPIVVQERIVMNFYTAKRLASALQLTIDRHEKVFGTIETDIEKRVKPQK